MQAVALRCEHREDVPCVDSDAPRLSWVLDSPEPGKRQTADRIQVGGAGGALWDTGCGESAETVDIPYGGLPLPPASEITWAVQVWDGDGNASLLYEPAHFLTGPATWEGVWIAADPASSRRVWTHPHPAYDPAMPVPGTDTDLDVSDLLMRRPTPRPGRRLS